MSSNSEQHQREAAVKIVQELLTGLPSDTAEALRAVLELIHLDHSTAEQKSSED